MDTGNNTIELVTKHNTEEEDKTKAEEALARKIFNLEGYHNEDKGNKK